MKNEELDEKFIERQRERLEALRDELVRMQHEMEDDERERGEAEGDFTEHDSGDQSLSMFTREIDATVGEQAARRLEDVNRALEKIEEETYGICDDTGEPIPRGRLEAMPEAIRTVEAQERFERERRPGR